MDLRRSINFARFGCYFCLIKVAFWVELNAIFLQLFLICAFSAPKSANKRTLTSISCAFKTRAEFWLTQYDYIKKKVEEYNKISHYFYSIFFFTIRMNIYFILFGTNVKFIIFLEKIVNYKLLLVLC